MAVRVWTGKRVRVTTVTATRAEKFARKFAKVFEDNGWMVEYQVEHEDPVMYRSSPDEVMIDGRTTVWFSVKHQHYWMGHGGAGWVTHDGAGDHRATTKFLGGYWYQFSARKPRNLSTYRKMAIWFSVVAK